MREVLCKGTGKARERLAAPTASPGREGRTVNPATNASGQSDGVAVPKKAANKGSAPVLDQADLRARRARAVPDAGVARKERTR